MIDSKVLNSHLFHPAMRIFLKGRFWGVVCALLGCSSLGCNRGTAPDPVKNSESQASKNATVVGEVQIDFADRTKDLGVQVVYDNGESSDVFSYIESIGGGVAVIDFDRDGWQDLFFPVGGTIHAEKGIHGLPNALWRNRQGLRFQDVSGVSQVQPTRFLTNGCTIGDFNEDGFSDILVVGYVGVQLWVNQGDGTFQELGTDSGLVDSLWGTSAGFGDLDNDGDLDLYVAHNTDWSWKKNPECLSKEGHRDVCPPAALGGIPDIAFINNGDGSFKAVTSEIGLLHDEGRGLAVMLADLDKDQKLDVYVANDTTANFLYHNVGGKLEETGIASGTAFDERGNPNGSMGIAIFDIDGNLQPDLWVTNYENETCALYKNDGRANFRCASTSTGIMAIGTLFVSFGTWAGDFDLDGDEDLVVSNGHVIRHPETSSVQQFPLFLRNNSKGKLIRQTFSNDNYFARKWRGRGVVTLDWDRDGDLDLAFSHVLEPAAILENRTKATGRPYVLELVGTTSNRDAIGSSLVFQTNKKKYLRQVVGGGSYLSQNPYEIHFGLPEGEELESVEITWPNGKAQTVRGLTPQAKNIIVQDP